MFLRYFMQMEARVFALRVKLLRDFSWFSALFSTAYVKEHKDNLPAVDNCLVLILASTLILFHSHFRQIN